MSSNGDYDREDLKSDLFLEISSVISAGSFATFGIIEDFVNPGISVEGQDPVRLPLSVVDAESLIQGSHRAPFGKGTETLVDESVRKTWEINASQIQFLNKRWQGCVDRIAIKAAGELGVATATAKRNNIHAELYKMLIYEEGAMFKAHKDTEKTPGMFGTLIICLPARHTGGKVHLQHGNKEETFDTSDSSTFDASYIAWYADVTHEIEPVQTGYRWVLTYNLVASPQSSIMSATFLESRVLIFRRLLSNWEDMENPPNYLVFPLSYQYTNESLQLSRLKGEDYSRTHYIAGSCVEHGSFHVLLANMKYHVTDYQSEEDIEDSVLYLERISDSEGYDLSIYYPKGRIITESNILGESLYNNREPDIQRGGGYLGNQHAEIDQFYKDSVIVIVPESSLCSFLLGRRPSPELLDCLMSKLREHIRQNRNSRYLPTARGICRTVLDSWLRDSQQTYSLDHFLGSIAVTAMFLNNKPLFSEAISRTKTGFAAYSYVALGEMFILEDSTLFKNDIIGALTKNGKLHKTVDNIMNFYKGFSRSMADRNDACEARQVKNWLDSIIYQTLKTVTDASIEDSECLTRVILDHVDETFNQLVIYQGVRCFVDRFSGKINLLIPLTIRVLHHLESPTGRSHSCLRSLLDRLLQPVVTHFDLSIYSSDNCSNLVKSLGYSPAGPIKALYTHLQASNPELGVTLLNRIQGGACDLMPYYCQLYLPSFVSELLSVIDSSCTSAQEYVYSLLKTYILVYVGHEPTKPTDWTRADEKCNCSCAACTRINDFLLDPHVSTITVACDTNTSRVHLPWRFDYLEFSDDHAITDANSATRTNKAINVTKTFKHWEQKHAFWQRQGENAIQSIQKLQPEEKLKECLLGNADDDVAAGKQRYRDIMELELVKAKPEDQASGGSSSSSSSGCDDGPSNENADVNNGNNSNNKRKRTEST